MKTMLGRTRQLALLMLALGGSAAAEVTSFEEGALSGSLAKDVLTLRNGEIETLWRVGAGVVGPVDSALWKRAGFCPVGVPEAGDWTWTATFSKRRDLPVSEPALVAQLNGSNGSEDVAYRFRLFEGVPAVEWRREAKPGTTISGDSLLLAVEAMAEEPPRFSSVQLQDHTDRHGKKDNLVQVTAHDLVGGPFKVAANVAFLGSGEGGVTFVKMAPLPHARAVEAAEDFTWDGTTLQWRGPGVNPVSGQGYPCAVIFHGADRASRIAALQDYYRCLRTYEPGRDGLLLSNTWGDRSRDAKIGEEFLMAEIKAGAELGVDVMQVDDGWQKGRTQNSATVTRSKAGVWSGFWRTDPEFWSAHPERLPNGLDPIAAAAKAKGLHLGIWYAPDSEDEFANWKRDADRILELHQAHGADYFKLDSITMTSPQAEWNVQQLLRRVIEESKGKIVVDLDVTAGVRPGYLGAVTCGTVFVENRYTDWGSYVPHQTLRNFWSLSEFVDPVRLRMEFLNNTRNVEKNEGKGDLAPAAYPPGYLFATVMCGSPLAWFEVSELPEAYAEEVGALVRIWRDHRAALHGGHLIPIGAEPDGHQWTGFASVAKDRKSGYLLVLRETNGEDTWETAVPFLEGRALTIEKLAGGGEVRAGNGTLAVTLPEPRSFVFLRFEVE